MATIPADRQIHTRLYIGRPDGTTWEDLSDYLVRAEVELGNVDGLGTGSAGVDGVVRRLSFTLRNDENNRFSPRDRNSLWNQFGGQYSPLLWPNREVILQVAISGSQESGTTSVFGEQAEPVPHTVTGEVLTLDHYIDWTYDIVSEELSSSETETTYYWSDTMAQDETYVVGADTDVVGDETDLATVLINQLFGTTHSTRQSPVFYVANTPIIPGTETVYINGTPTEHYGLDYDTGRLVVFDESWQSGDTVTIDYQFKGNAGIYMLANDNIKPGSESVYFNGDLTTNYDLDYAAGRLTLYINDSGSGTVAIDYQYYDWIEYKLSHINVFTDALVVVYVNGNVVSDYTVDYDAGLVIFDTARARDDVVTVDYTYWVRLFHGYLGDNISTSGPTITCECRDLAKRLQDTYIEEVREYGSEAGTPAEDVIQQILDDNLGTGVVTLYCPVSPGFMIKPYKVEYQSVWDAIQQVAAQIGWFLGYRWDPGTGQFRLTLMEPPRTKDASTADFVLDYEDDFYQQDLDINDADIRNVIKVVYRDASTGERTSVTVEDSTSIAEYGRRAMQIEEADTSLIDTQQEATDLANAALADLKDLTATTRLDMPLLPNMDVFAGIVIHDPRVSSTDDFYGVESVRHTLDFEGGRFRTEVVASGRIIGSRQRWLRMETRPGASVPPAPEVILGGGRILSTPAGITATGIIRGIAVDVPAPPVNANRWATTEVHVSSTSGFTPSSSTLKAQGRVTHFEITEDLQAGTTYYVKAIYVDVGGNKSAASSEVSAVAAKVADRDLENNYPILLKAGTALAAGGGASGGDIIYDSITVPPGRWVIGIVMPFETYNPDNTLNSGGAMTYNANWDYTTDTFSQYFYFATDQGNYTLFLPEGTYTNVKIAAYIHDDQYTHTQMWLRFRVMYVILEIPAQ